MDQVDDGVTAPASAHDSDFPAPACRWQAPADGSLMLRRLDEDWLVHDDRTGATHLLDPVAGGVLAALTAAPLATLDAVELSTALRTGTDTEPGGGLAAEDWHQAIEECLRALDAASLVCSVPRR